MTTRSRATHSSDTDLRYLRRSFVRHLAADRRSTATRAAYGAAINQLDAFLGAQGLPTKVTRLQPDHIDAFFVSMHEAAAATRDRPGPPPYAIALLRLAGG